MPAAVPCSICSKIAQRISTFQQQSSTWGLREVWRCDLRIENENQVDLSLSCQHPFPNPFSFQGDDDTLGTEIMFSELKLEQKVSGDDLVWDSRGGRAGKRSETAQPGAPRTKDQEGRCRILVTGICLSCLLSGSFPQGPTSLQGPHICLSPKLLVPFDLNSPSNQPWRESD